MKNVAFGDWDFLGHVNQTIVITYYTHYLLTWTSVRSNLLLPRPWLTNGISRVLPCKAASNPIKTIIEYNYNNHYIFQKWVLPKPLVAFTRPFTIFSLSFHAVFTVVRRTFHAPCCFSHWHSEHFPVPRAWIYWINPVNQGCFHKDYRSLVVNYEKYKRTYMFNAWMFTHLQLINDIKHKSHKYETFVIIRLDRTIAVFTNHQRPIPGIEKNAVAHRVLRQF